MMFILEYIAELVAKTPGISDCLVNIAVGMTVNPVVYTAIGYVFAKFYSECSID